MEYVMIDSVAKLAEVLGGPSKASRTLDSTPQKICNYMAVNKFPSDLYLLHQVAISRRGINASPRLWFGDRVPAGIRISVELTADA